jgi:hypothetical protein
MSEPKTKTIQINPDLFSLSSKNTTRKQTKKSPKEKAIGPIKIKNPTTRNKSNATMKRNLLKMFRNHYDEKYKQGNVQAKKDVQSERQPVKSPTPVLPIEPKSDFESSFEYLKQVSSVPEPKKIDVKPTLIQAHPKPMAPKLQNHTLKQHTPLTNNPPIQMNLPPVFNTSTLPLPNPIEPPMILKPPTHMVPQYGCMKNGDLPTYRSWKHSTQRNNPKISNIPKPNASSLVQASIPSEKYNKHMEKQLEEMSLLNQRKERNGPKLFKHRIPKQKRIRRRTFHVGKSKQHPRISVLVSNRTIRNNTNLHLSKLKNTPMHEVKTFLLKHGFIKVGSNTPTDVLRQMYESASLICGEVKNRNPDNLLYNYFNESMTENEY